MDADRGTAPSLWRAVRAPVAAAVVLVLLWVLATALDTGGEGARNAALLIGAALYFLAPAVLVWLVAAVVVHRRRRS